MTDDPIGEDADDHRVAAWIATTTGAMLVDLVRHQDYDRRWGGLEYEGDRRPPTDRGGVGPAPPPTTWSSPRKAATTGRGSIRNGSGLSIRSMDPATTGTPRTGRSTWRWWLISRRSQERSPSLVGTRHGPRILPLSRCRLRVEDGEQPRIVVSRARSRYDGYRLQDAIGADIFTVGSAGVKAMAVVRGEVDAYVHGGGLYEWDSCAPVAVARAAGLMCCHLDGSELRFNKPDPWSPGLVIARPGLVDRHRRCDGRPAAIR